MRKVAINTIIDAFIFLFFTCLISTGILIAVRLPPGSGRLNILGLTRHQWGDLHLAIAIAFITLVIAHLFLHRTWITSIFQRDNKIVTRVALVTILILLPAACLIMPIAAPTNLPSDVSINQQSDRHSLFDHQFRKHRGH